MKIIWQGTDITGYVMIRKAVARDTCGGRCDGLDIEFENAETWYRWGPAEDDEIRVTRDGWDSGILYLNTIAPGEGKYRVLATALPCRARKKEWRSFEGLSIGEILEQCAARTGMETALFGVDGERTIPYILQENESAASFLTRLAVLEGAKMKCVNGKYTFIGLEWAQDRKPDAAIRLRPDQQGFDYRRQGTAFSGADVTTPYAKGSAADTAVSAANPRLALCDLPAMDNIQAARWARNILREKNRKCESLTLDATFTPNWTAMGRINIAGETDARGQWIIEEVEHDLKEGHSRATLHRCIRSVE